MTSNDELEKVLNIESLEVSKQNKMDQQQFIDQFMNSQGRAFKRKFTKEKFSDRIRKSINTKKDE